MGQLCTSSISEHCTKQVFSWMCTCTNLYVCVFVHAHIMLLNMFCYLCFQVTVWLVLCTVIIMSITLIDFCITSINLHYTSDHSSCCILCIVDLLCVCEHLKLYSMKSSITHIQIQFQMLHMVPKTELLTVKKRSPLKSPSIDGTITGNTLKMTHGDGYRCCCNYQENKVQKDS